MCPYGRAHWRHLANTIKPSVCMWPRCGLMSNYFDHLLLFGCIAVPCTAMHAAYCYRPSSMVCESVCHTSEPGKYGETDRDAVWAVDSGEPREPSIRWGPDPSWKGAILRGGKVTHSKV